MGGRRRGAGSRTQGPCPPRRRVPQRQVRALESEPGSREPSRWPTCSSGATEHAEDAGWQRGRPPASPIAPRAPPACTRSASSLASR
ncbi:rCG43955, isoform CRA_d [Rattus norvegicus]|uniref:RCG43955, isoform CRA_d n=1 Tax=Rattus norvegicus TaxID=10116 RepID=A6J7M9_RAT|nr:rCG43955, isoform CRA_d [Rattus norvegicus]